jgi:hypothetical protein
MKWSYEGKVGRSLYAKAKEISAAFARKILLVLKLGAIQVGSLIRKGIAIIYKKGRGRSIKNQKVKATKQISEKQPSSSYSRPPSSTETNNSAAIGKKKAIRSGQALKQVGVVLGASLYQATKQTINAIKHKLEQDNLYYNNLVRTSSRQEKQQQQQHQNLPPIDPEITTKLVTLNEQLAEEMRQEIHVECQAVEVNSLPIEHKPYYSYKVPMSPRIITNRGCIRVKGRKFGLVHVIQRN